MGRFQEIHQSYSYSNYVYLHLQVIVIIFTVSWNICSRNMLEPVKENALLLLEN